MPTRWNRWAKRPDNDHKNNDDPDVPDPPADDDHDNQSSSSSSSSRLIVVLRGGLCIVLCGLIAGLGAGCYALLRANEVRTFRRQFGSITSQISTQVSAR